MCEGYSGACLPVDQAPQPGLALDDAVGNPHLAAQGRQEDHELDGIHIVSDRHQLSLLVLHQGGDSVDLCSKDRWPLGGDVAFAGGFLLSSGQQPLLLLLLCLWSVLGGQFKQLSSCLSVQGLGELLNCRRHFQQLIENSPLPLQPDVAGPFDKAGEVPLGLDVLSIAKILGPLLEQGVDHLLGLLLLHHGQGRGLLLPLGLLSLRDLEGLAYSRVFSNESTLHIGWPKYCSFGFSISPSSEYSGLISFRMDWFDLLQPKGLSKVFSNTP